MSLSREANKALHTLAVRRNYEPYRSLLQDSLMEYAWWDLGRGNAATSNLCLICCEYFPFNSVEAHGIKHLKEHNLLAFL